MKKLFVTTLFVLLVLLLSLYACTDVMDDLENYVSYLEKDLYISAIDGYAVEWVVGVESGVAFGKVKVYPTSADDGLKKQLSVIVDGSTIPLKKSTTRYAYETKLSSDVLPQVAQLKIDDVSYDLVLTSIKEDTVDYVTALKASATEFYDRLNQDYEQGFSYTVSVKLVPDRLGEKPYYYYVSFSKADEVLATLVDPTTGLVVAKRGGFRES